jgi:hypothetical protein
VSASGPGDLHEHERAIRDALRPGDRVRIDWKNDRLRRTFRAVATVIELQDTSGEDRRVASPDDPDRTAAGWNVLVEVKPRFGAPTRQRIDGGTIVKVRPA